MSCDRTTPFSKASSPQIAVIASSSQFQYIFFSLTSSRSCWRSLLYFFLKWYVFEGSSYKKCYHQLTFIGFVVCFRFPCLCVILLHFSHDWPKRFSPFSSTLQNLQENSDIFLSVQLAPPYKVILGVYHEFFMLHTKKNSIHQFIEHPLHGVRYKYNSPQAVMFA